MFSIDTSHDDYLRVHATGRLTSGDYDRLEPALAEALGARGGRAPLLLDLTGWRGWTAGGLVRDLRFDLRHRNSFSRIAVVGDRAWHKWLTYAARPLFSGRMRYFKRGQERQAMKWLESC